MAVNIKGGRANVCIAKVDATIESMGLNATNIVQIFEVGDTLKSWVPDRPFNPLTSIMAGRGYWIIAIIDLDLTAYFSPPLDGENVIAYYTGEALPGTIPPTNNVFQRWLSKTPGTYTNFEDSLGDPIVIENTEILNGLVEIWGNDGVYEKVVFTILPTGTGYATLTTDPNLYPYNNYRLVGGAGSYLFESALGIFISLDSTQATTKMWEVYRTSPTGYWTLLELPFDVSQYLIRDEYLTIGNAPDSSYIIGPVSGLFTRILPWTISAGQSITKVKMKGAKAGTMPIKLFRRGSGNDFTFVDSVNIEVVTGIASYEIETSADEELYIGLFQNGTGAGGQPSYKNGSQGGFYFDGSNVMDTQTFTPTTTILYAIEFELTVFGDLKPIEDRLKEVEKNFVGNVLDAVSSDMTGVGGWIVGLGAPTLDISDGTMKLTLTTGNQQVYINALTAAETYEIEMRIRRVSGNIKRVSIGQFTSTPAASWSSIPVTSEWQVLKFNITAFNQSLSIGALAASNLGGVVEIDYIKAIVSTGLDFEIEDVSKSISLLGIQNDTNMNLGNVWSSLSKFDKTLNLIIAESDSLFANGTGGVIPSAEPTTQRPIRLGYSNTIPRRIYDLLSWNKPQWRRLDDPAWTKSGTWTPINTTAIFEPTYSNETYTTTGTPNAYAEITVPSGMENFAIVVREFTSLAELNVTLNGTTMPSDNGVSTYDTNLVGAGHTGNPYKILHFKNLPAGDNVIRITKDATANSLFVWGGFWWTGNTLVVMNVAHGGHTMDQLIDQHINDEVVRNNPDAVLFQVTEMNEMSTPNARNTESALRYILGSVLNGKDVLVTTPHPFGKSPVTPFTNFYDVYKTPLTMKELNLLVKRVAHEYGHPFLDKFTIFERKILNKGGTLEAGDAGKYTDDGQHQSIFGMLEDWNLLKQVLLRIVIMNS